MIEIAAGHFVEFVLSDSEQWQIRMKDNREARERELATERAFLTCKSLFTYNRFPDHEKMHHIRQFIRFEMGLAYSSFSLE